MFPEGEPSGGAVNCEFNAGVNHDLFSQSRKEEHEALYA